MQKGEGSVDGRGQAVVHVTQVYFTRVLKFLVLTIYVCACVERCLTGLDMNSLPTHPFRRDAPQLAPLPAPEVWPQALGMLCETLRPFRLLPYRWASGC